MAVIQLTLSVSERTRKRLPGLSEEPLPRSVAKCEALAALPPLPKTKICRSSRCACLSVSIRRPTASAGMESTALLCAARYSETHCFIAPPKRKTSPRSTGKFRQRERADGHDILAQCRELHRRRRSKRVHDETRQLLRHCRAPRFANQRQPATEDDDFGMEQMHAVREREREIFRCLAQDALGRCVLTRQRRRQVTGFA